MLTLSLRRIIIEKGHEDPNYFLRKCGIPGYTASRLLRNQVNNLSFKYLEKICFELNCTIDDLFTFTDTTESVYTKNHPLNKLKRAPFKPSLTGKIKQLSIDELDKVRAFISDLEKTKNDLV